MSEESSGYVDARLARFTKPQHYDLHYSSIDFDQNTFAGRVSILFKTIKSPTAFILSKRDGTNCIGMLLHALDLHLDQARIEHLSCGNSRSLHLEADNFRYSTVEQICRIEFPYDENSENVFVLGQSYKLTIDFHGVLNSNMQGLYRSSYKDRVGQEHFIATTQFEPTDARRALPCFDEPNLKATFCLSVTLPAEIPYSSMKCISNTPITSNQTIFEGEKKRFHRIVTFQKTPLMSTYLLALVIGDFDSISSTSEITRIMTTVYTVPGKVNQGKFCLDVASQCLDLYKDLFDVPYPLVKSDLLAIPDFAAGAMEVRFHGSLEHRLLNSFYFLLFSSYLFVFLELGMCYVSRSQGN